jgi:hypothetical protein
MGGGMIGDVDIGDDDAYFHKGLILVKQPKLDQIIDARLLEVGQVFCVVYMSLRVQVSVADFSGVEEFVIGHVGIIVVSRIVE